MWELLEKRREGESPFVMNIKHIHLYVQSEFHLLVSYAVVFVEDLYGPVVAGLTCVRCPGAKQALQNKIGISKGKTCRVKNFEIHQVRNLNCEMSYSDWAYRKQRERGLGRVLRFCKFLK